jgi:hypothetical protein
MPAIGARRREIRGAKGPVAGRAELTACDRKVHREKPLGRNRGDRTKTNTGWQGEDPKALERSLVKELGTLTP